MRTPTLEPHAAASLVRRWRRATDPSELTGIYEALRALGPVVPTGWGALLVTGYDECRQVLEDRNWHTCDARWRDAHRPGWRADVSTVLLCKTPLQQNPPEHTARRRPLAGALNPRAARGATTGLIEPLVAEYLGTFRDRIRRSGSADFMSAVGRPLPTAVLAGLMGLPPEVDQAWLTVECLAAARVEELAAPPSLIRRANEAAVRQMSCFEQILAERRRRPADDVLSRWAIEEPAHAAHLLLTLFTAGLATTTGLLASLTLALTTRPELAERVRRNPGFADRLVEEVLRWDPPGRVITRMTTSDAELGGRVVPAGSVVHALVGAAHRDPRVFPDPHAFDPDRPGRRLLAFGSGLHYCVGAYLSRFHAESFVRTFARELPGARLSAEPVRQPGPSMPDVNWLPIALP